jgi:hypothetical protein
MRLRSRRTRHERSPVDLHVDLNSEDDAGLPWGLLNRPPHAF